MLRIVIDAGHGGKDPGAIGADAREKDVTLSVANQLCSILSQHKLVKTTRDTDIYVSLQDRVRIAEDFGADLFISLHCNAFADPTPAGLETYCYSYKSKGYTTALALHKYILNVCGFEGHRYTDRGVKAGPNLYVLRKTSMPAILVEMGFITNANDRAWIVSRRGQLAISYAIAQAILATPTQVTLV